MGVKVNQAKLATKPIGRVVLHAPMHVTRSQGRLALQGNNSGNHTPNMINKSQSKVVKKALRLMFAQGNAKLDKKVGILSLPAGYSCPFAELCLSKSNKNTGKIQDGPLTQFLCFAASAEALFKNIRKSRWGNFNKLRACKSIESMAELILASLPNTPFIRFHGSGDFYSQDYFDAWLMVARVRPSITFYGYTKALPFWVKRIDSIPANMHLVASQGGRYDNLIGLHGLRFAKVVLSEKQAAEEGLPIDHDDRHVWDYSGNFALLIHGTQPAGSESGKAYSILKAAGKAGYSGIGAHFQKQRELSAAA